ncbi:MAG: hypothetical protein RLZZ292_3578 [Bacteroidota bacterium]|jgi:phosphatidylglycerophosphate synthase
MSKLASKDKFLDLSDYGRPLAVWFAQQLKFTRFTPIHVTLLFGAVGLGAIYFILTSQYFLAGVFLILKSIIDAADGELSRVKNTPSYTGRYLDSIFDIVLNFLVLSTICYVSTTTFPYMLLAFVAIQLQGTLYNYYYVILRNNSVGADTTSQIFEHDTIPKAFPYESQTAVTILFTIYSFCYRLFDQSIYLFDKKACQVKRFPNWFMTCVSIYGLGFQLLLIAIMLSLNLINWIIPFLIGYSLFIGVFIGVRKKWIG